MAVEHETVAVQINRTNILAMLNTGNFKTIPRDDEYVKIILRPTAHIFREFGNHKAR